MSLKLYETNCRVSSTNGNEHEEAEFNNITGDVLKKKKEIICFVAKNIPLTTRIRGPRLYPASDGLNNV